MNRIIRFSGKISLILLLLVTIVLIIATFLEKQYGTDFAYRYFYTSPLTIACWFTLSIYGAIYLLSQKTYKRVPVLCLHTALLLILAGALVTHISSEKGIIHLRDGEPNHFYHEETSGIQVIPFTLQLKSFTIEYYAGTESPSDYVSSLEIYDPLNDKRFCETLSMNNIFNYKGYRFYQSSYDEDLKGSILSINRDIYGIPITYAGYYLLFISVLLLLFDKNGRFRKLLRSPVLKKTFLLLTVSFMLSLNGQASPVNDVNEISTLSRQQAKMLGSVWIYYEGRIVPLNTFAIDFTVKLTGKQNYLHFNSEQFVAGCLLLPEIWADIPFLKITNKQLQEIVGKQNASVNDLYIINHENTRYKLAPYYKTIYQGDVQTEFSKQAGKLDEKVQLFNILSTGDLLNFFPFMINGRLHWYSAASTLPDEMPETYKNFIRSFSANLKDASLRNNHNRFVHILKELDNYQQQYAQHVLPSTARRQSEVFYNKVIIFGWLFKINLILGFLSLMAFMLQTVTNNKISGKIAAITSILLIAVFIVLSAGLALRTYIGGRLPLSNGYETMLFTAWCALLVAVLLRRYSMIISSFGLLISGFTLLVAHLSAMNPKIGNLVPVLSSPLLSIHVSVIMLAYAFAAFLAFNSLITFSLILFGNRSNAHKIRLTIKKLRVLSEIFLYPCTLLLAAGIFIGAIWANVSWGRYWGWDPKEVWALVTLLVASLPFHSKTLSWFKNTFFFNMYLLLILASVLMTYFGVNYFLGGIHSYAGDAETSSFILIISIVSISISGLLLLAFSRYKKLIKK